MATSKNKASGGPHPKSPPEEIADIISKNKDCPSYSGIEGVDYNESGDDIKTPQQWKVFTSLLSSKENVNNTITAQHPSTLPTSIS